MTKKVFEVEVAAVIKPKAFQIPMFLLGLLIIGFLVGAGLFSSNSQQREMQKNNETGTAVANFETSTMVSLLATDYSKIEATNISENATQIVVQRLLATRQVQNTAQAFDEAKALVVFTGVNLLTMGQVSWFICGESHVPCGQVTYIEYTITNKWTKPVVIYLEGMPCTPPSLVDGNLPRITYPEGSRLNPDTTGTVICSLVLANGLDPAKYAVDIRLLNDKASLYDCWKKYPYTGRVENCQ